MRYFRLPRTGHDLRLAPREPIPFASVFDRRRTIGAGCGGVDTSKEVSNPRMNVGLWDHHGVEVSPGLYDGSI